MAGLPGLRYIREREGLLQSDLSKLAKISTQVISDLENGKVGTRTSTMERIARALNCTAADLLTPPQEVAQDA